MAALKDLDRAVGIDYLGHDLAEVRKNCAAPSGEHFHGLGVLQRKIVPRHADYIRGCENVVGSASTKELPPLDPPRKGCVVHD